MRPPSRHISSTFPEETWWREGVIYQIYPRSFQDTNGDGVGDLCGVIDRLDYLVRLGVDAIWLAPIFCSPMADGGYDISDHQLIDPQFGDLPTFRRLVTEAHNRGLKVILDFVPNHTSDQHPWFQASRSARRGPMRNWYIWADGGPDGGPPNNWRSEFGGAAWTWDALTEQFYYHAFLSSQPDLNWRNPAVVEAMLQVLRFWVGHGVDGFRVDAIHHLFEDVQLRDNPVNPAWTASQGPTEQFLKIHTVDQIEVHRAVRAMRHVVKADDVERVLIGEAYLPLPQLMTYYGAAGDGFDLPFNFHLMTADWTPTAIAELVVRYEASLPVGAWPNWVLSNHDRSRVASRLGSERARVAAVLLLTLRGTPTLYQGDELGLTDVLIPPEKVRDPWESNVPGMGLGRDPARTPMLWSGAINAGFSSAEPWLPLSPDWEKLNVSRQTERPGSMLRLHHDLLRLRRLQPALRRGDFRLIEAGDSLLAFERSDSNDRLIVALDLCGEGGSLLLGPGSVVLSTRMDRGGDMVEGELRLAPNEGVIFKPAS